MGIPHASEIDQQLAAAEGLLVLARELVSEGKATSKAAISRHLAGVVSNVEAVRIVLGRPALKHCSQHDIYTEKCHDCYTKNYGKLATKGGRK